MQKQLVMQLIYINHNICLNIWNIQMHCLIVICKQLFLYISNFTIIHYFTGQKSVSQLWVGWCLLPPSENSCKLKIYLHIFVPLKFSPHIHRLNRSVPTKRDNSHFVTLVRQLRPFNTSRNIAYRWCPWNHIYKKNKQNNFLVLPQTP